MFFSLKFFFRSGDDKLGVFAREAANSATKMVVAAKAAQKSAQAGAGKDGNIDAIRVVQGADAIVANPTDVAMANNVAKQITRACGNLLNTAKAKAHDEPDQTKKQHIVKAAQKVVNDATDLAQAARAAGSKNQADAGNLAKTAKTLKAGVQALEEAMGTGPNSAVDPATAKKLVAEARAVAASTAALIQSSVVLSGNPQAKKSQEDLSKKSEASATAVQNILRVAGTLNPAVQSVDRAIDVLVKVSADLDSAAVAAQTGGRVEAPASGRSVKDVQQDTLGVCKAVAFDMKELLVNASQGKAPEELVPGMEKFEKTAPSLAIDILSLAGR
jgi:hypothetical protein